MRFGSLFSGVGGFDLGFERAGMECVWQAENNKHALQVLANHWPNVKRYEDVKDVGRKSETVDLICGGFPCQDLSVAGKRAGLAGERSGLWFEFRRIIEELAPTWVVIENVPGLLSSNKGRDMAILLGGLAQLGYGWAYRVLDSQYHGVAQRRRRVFIVGYFGDARVAAKVLFEPESRDWDSTPRREKGQGHTRVAGTLASSGGGLDRPAGQGNELDFVIAHGQANAEITKGLVPTLNDNHEQPITPRTVNVRGGKEGGGKGYLESENGMTLGGQPQWLAFQQNTRDEVRLMGGRGDHAGALAAQAGMKQQNYVAPSLTASNDPSRSPQSSEVTRQIEAVSSAGFGVRRLTPVECERLQGFPDNWSATGIEEDEPDGESEFRPPVHSVPMSDTQRYKMMGNAVTVNVIEWIGKRIMAEQMESRNGR